MNSVLKIGAFSHDDEVKGIIALLETALEALDSSGHTIAAAYVDMGRHAYLNKLSEKAAEHSDGIGSLD